MKTLILIALFTLFFCSVGFSQTKFPVEFKVEKQSMSTPMTPMEEVIFTNFYFSRPVNIKFDGAFLNMCFDNGETFVKKNVTEVNRDKQYEDDVLMQETIFYTDNKNASDTISFVVNYTAGYVQLVLPTKNSKGDYLGYTSYRKFIDNKLASR